jgi:hypothetical protein
VQYTGDELIYGINNLIERAVRNNTMSAEESARFMRCYKESLGGYTYLLWESPASQFSSITGPTCEPQNQASASPSIQTLARTA